MIKFIVFLFFFLGGFVLMGIATELPAWQGLAFGGGILSVALALGLVIHSPSNQTRRSEGLEG